ncbi:MAG: thiamine pyrophosphate-dependent dehydrogenase E1 component subunit alpha [Pseudomonadota bacterium]
MELRTTLGALADPHSPIEPLELRNLPASQLTEDLRTMVRIRQAEAAVGDMVESGEAKCPCHLGIGQEGVAVGICGALTAKDRLYGGHRAHSQYIALGGDLTAMFAEILGKQTGTSKGMGGSMHLYAPETGFHGSVPIVAGTVPVAVGAALAAKMDGSDVVAVPVFGDGACEEGGVHEALNMASIMTLPVVFVVENNLYSSHLDINLRQPFDSVARFAQAHGIETEVVDGNDVVATRLAMERLVARARRGEGPGFLEAVTYRWRGHVGHREDIDVGVRRSSEEVAAWRARDPIQRLVDALISRKDLGEGEFDAITTHVQGEVDSALAAARQADYPPVKALLDMVYAHAAGGR